MYKDITTISTTSSGIPAIKQSIKNILMTPIGSLPGDPTFGSSLYRVVFEPLDYLTTSMAVNYVKESLQKFEDRIIVKDVQFKQEEAFNRLIVSINFSYKNITQNELAGDSSVSLAINF